MEDVIKIHKQNKHKSTNIHRTGLSCLATIAEDVGVHVLPEMLMRTGRNTTAMSIRSHASKPVLKK
jgi:hypothetical protein